MFRTYAFILSLDCHSARTLFEEVCCFSPRGKIYHRSQAFVDTLIYLVSHDVNWLRNLRPRYLLAPKEFILHAFKTCVLLR